MIVRHHELGFSIVLQRHHARIAAILLHKLSWLIEDSHRADLLTITATHDNDYNEFRSQDLLAASGAPRDFTMAPFSKEKCDKLLEESLATGLFQAALSAEHMIFVHGQQSAEAEKYCANLRAEQKKWMSQLNLRREDLERYYTMLEWCDALSLILCQELVPPEARQLEISAGPDGTNYFIKSLEEGVYHIAPWPFTTSAFSFDMESRLLPKLSYRSDKELQTDLRLASVKLEKYTFKK